MLISKALDNHQQNPRAGGGGCGGTGQGAVPARLWVLPSPPWTDGRRVETRRGSAFRPVPREKAASSTACPGGRQSKKAARVALAAPKRAPAVRGDPQRPQLQPYSRLRRGWAAAERNSSSPGSPHRDPGASVRLATRSVERAMGPSPDWASLPLSPTLLASPLTP